MREKRRTSDRGGKRKKEGGVKEKKSKRERERERELKSERERNE